MTDTQICENCSRANPINEMICTGCGQLLPAGRAAIATHGLAADPFQKEERRWGTAYFGEQTLLRVHMRDTNEMIETRFEEHCILGRAVDDNQPDVDLAPHKGAEFGVSRQHVKLTRQEQTVMVQDLGSLNGTYLNGKRLLPFQPRVLRNEDELMLGHLRLRVSFMRAPNSQPDRQDGQA